MRVEVLTTMDGSPDGVLVRTYEVGGIYEMPTGLAEVFLAEGWGREVKGAADVQEEAPAPPPGPVADKAEKPKRKTK